MTVESDNLNQELARVQAENAELRNQLTQYQVVAQQLKESISEKETLLQEIHHRVKNNLQVIISLLRLQSYYIEDESAMNMLRDTQSRVLSMAKIHERLYRTKNLSQIDMGAYIAEISNHLMQFHKIAQEQVSLNLQTEPLMIKLDKAIPFALIVHELISNAFKHAFPERRKGSVQVSLHTRASDTIDFSVKDDGVGLPVSIRFPDSETLGLKLVAMMVDQLEGEVTLTRTGGTHFDINFN